MDSVAGTSRRRRSDRAIDPTIRIARLLTAAVTLVAVHLLALTAPAGAHSEEGEMTIVRAAFTDPLTIEVEVGVLYADGHLAETAEVWVSATTPGTALEPVGLEHQGGEGSARYRGEITVPEPGEWTLRVESASPTSSATTTVSVPNVSEETETPGAPDEDPDTTGDEDPADTTPGEDPDAGDADAGDTPAGGTDTAAEDTAADGDEEDGGSAWILPAVVIAVIVVGGGAYLASRRRGEPTGS